MQNSLFQSQNLKQEQILAPQQLQSLEILSLPVTDLQHKINEELEVNPTLELERISGEDLAGDPLSENTELPSDAMNAPMTYADGQPSTK